MNNTHSSQPQQKKVIITVLSILILVGGVIGYTFFFSPKVLAQEYLEEIGKDLHALQAKIDYYEGAFTSVSKSFETSKGAFYEMTTPRTYFDAVEDTKKDIEEIKATLALIEEAKKTRENLQVPEELKAFDESVKSYYEKIEAGMNILLTHQEFQMQMLTASGDELNSYLTTLDEIIAKPSTVQEFVEVFGTTAELAEQSAERFRQIKSIPDFEQEYYQSKLEYHEDLAKTFGQATKEVAKQTPAGDKTVKTLLEEFYKRLTNSNKAREDETKTWVEKSPIKTYFEEAVVLEPKILSELESLKKQFDIPVTPTVEPTESEEIPTPSETIEITGTIVPTISTTPEVTNSAE